MNHSEMMRNNLRTHPLGLNCHNVYCFHPNWTDADYNTGQYSSMLRLALEIKSYCRCLKSRFKTSTDIVSDIDRTKDINKKGVRCYKTNDLVGGV